MGSLNVIALGSGAVMYAAGAEGVLNAVPVEVEAYGKPMAEGVNIIVHARSRLAKPVKATITLRGSLQGLGRPLRVSHEGGWHADEQSQWWQVELNPDERLFRAALHELHQWQPWAIAFEAECELTAESTFNCPGGNATLPMMGASSAMNQQ